LQGHPGGVGSGRQLLENLKNPLFRTFPVAQVNRLPNNRYKKAKVA
jgi:hypothetical protein